MKPFLLVTSAKAALLAALLGAAACGGPRMQLLTTQKFAPLAPDERVDVYVGKLDPPFQAIAKIDSTAYREETEEVRQAQLEELRAHARKLGANTLDEVQILTKQINGVAVDEKVPFRAWQQGTYPLYFMRATALRRPLAEPETLAEVEPKAGWATQGLPRPRRLDSASLGSIAMPGLRDAASSPTATAAP